MAGVLKVRTIVNCTGLDEEVNIDTGEVTMTVPIEHSGSPLYIVHSTATTTAMQLSTLFSQYDIEDIYAVYIKAISGTIYLMLNTSGTATFDETTADEVLLEGKPVFKLLNFYLGSGSANGMTIDAASTSDVFSISVWVKTPEV